MNSVKKTVFSGDSPRTKEMFLGIQRQENREVKMSGEIWTVKVRERTEKVLSDNVVTVIGE